MNLIKKQLLEAIDYLNRHKHSNAIRIIENLKEDIKEILEPHWSIQAEDEQYSDPEMWDYGPIYDGLQEAYDVLELVDVWFGEDEPYEDYDIEAMEKASKSIQSIIVNMR
jgi:hypothetical protein